MRTNARKTFYYHANANSLGGFVEKPLQKTIPSQASVSLHPVGGHATTRTEAFNFEEIVSCSAAYTRVSGRQMEQDGAWSLTATAVVEGLKILEVLTADRLVAQVSVEYPNDGGYLKVSLAGSRFEGLRLGGYDASPMMSSKLLHGAKAAVTHPVFLQTAREQADKITSSINAEQNRNDFQGLAERFGSIASNQEPQEDRWVLCSLVDGVDQSIPGTSFGHVVVIPDFGTIFLGELLVSRSSIKLYSFRAELGCGTSGHVSGPTANVEGVPYP
jgi:hypothetical protein